MPLKLIIAHIKLDILKLNVLRTFVKIFRLKRRFPQMKIFTYKALVRSIQKRNDVCHVIATGSSAVDSYKAGVVQPDDYIIGLNFAAFLPYTFDLYFFEEPFGKSDFRISRGKSIAELLYKRKKYLPNLVFKNACRVRPDLMANTIPDIRFSVVYDRVFYYPIVKKFFTKPSVFMPQYCTSAISAVMLAYHAGFKNIVVHGIDFSGPHIYHDQELQEKTGLDAPHPYIPKDEPLSADAQAHQMIWPKLMQMFAKNNVQIFCASESSNFKKYAAVYR